MSDDILLKSVSNKRWVKKIINEAFPSNANTPLANFLMNLSSGSTLFYTDNGDNFILSTYIEYNYKEEYFISTNMSDKQLENTLKNESNYDFGDWNLKNIEFVKLYSYFFHKRAGNYDTYVRYRPVVQIIVDKNTGFSTLQGTIVYIITDLLSEIKNTNDFNKRTRKKLNLRRINSGGTQKHFYLSNDMYDELEPYLFGTIKNKNIDFQGNGYKSGDFTVNQILIKQKEDIKVETTEDIDAKQESITWFGKKKKSTSKVVPEIKTNLLVTDERFRKLPVVCDMVISNATKLKNSILDSERKGITRNVVIYSDEDINQYDFFNRVWTPKEIEKQNKKYQDAVSEFNSSEEKIIQARVCYAYYDEMTKIKQNDWLDDIKYSAGLNYCLHNYMVEITSPLAIITNNVTWNTLNGHNGKDVLERVVGIPSSNWESNSVIMYPLNQGEPLADSEINLNGKRIRVSTKGGLNGKGAYATIKSLREYVFEDNGDGNISPFGKKIKQEYGDLFEIFDILTSKIKKVKFTNNQWNSLYQCIRNLTNNKKINTKKQIQDYLNKDLNNIWSKMIMKILESASYDFVQINAKATSTSGDFTFEYTAQYPAVFSGKVKVLINDDGGCQFHIEE